MAVDPDYRDRGIASALFSRLIEIMRSHGYKRFMFQASEESLPFWRNRGTEIEIDLGGGNYYVRYDIPD